MMRIGGQISSPDDFHDIQSLDNNLDLKSQNPNERLKEVILKAQKTTNLLPKDKQDEWKILLNDISRLDDRMDDVWGNSEKNDIIDEVDRKITKFIVDYVAEQVRVREEERQRIENKGKLVMESISLMAKYTVLDQESLNQDYNFDVKPKLSDDLVKINLDLDKYFNKVVGEVSSFDRTFMAYTPKVGLFSFSLKCVDSFNDSLAEKLNIQRKSLDEMGVNDVLIKEILELKEAENYRNLVTRQKDIFKNLFTRETPNGFIIKFDLLENFKGKLSTEFYDKFDNFSKFIRLQDLLEDYEIESQILGGTVTNNGESMVVKEYKNDRLIGRKLEDGVNGGEDLIKIHTNTVVEFNVRSLEQEYDLEGAKQDLEKNIDINSSINDLENQILDLKFHKETFERAGDYESLVKLESKIHDGEALWEWKNYESTEGYDKYFGLSDLENVDGWVENLSAFANVSFLEKLQSDFSDIDYDKESSKEADLMDLSVKVVGYKLNRLQSKFDLLPIGSQIRDLISNKLQEESKKFIDISLNIGDSKEDKSALDESLGLKRLTDYMTNLGDFDKAYEYFVEQSSKIDENNFQSENLKRVYQNFNRRCLYVLQNYLKNEREMVVSLGSKPDDYTSYLKKVNKLARFITGRGESIDMELESGSSALILITQALELPEKMVANSWASPENDLMKNYRDYKADLEKQLNSMDRSKRLEIDQACDGNLEEVLKLVMDEPKSIEDYSEKYFTLRILRDSLMGYPTDMKRYQSFLTNGVNDYKKICINKTKSILSESDSTEGFVKNFAQGFNSEEMKLVETLSDVQGFGILDISDQTIHNGVFIAKFTALVGASLAASLLSTPFTGGTSLLVGATSVAAIATTASHVLYGKGYDSTEEAFVGIGAEAGVNFFGALGGGSFGNALRISAIQKSTGLTREAVKKGLLTGDELLTTGALTEGEKALYFTGQMVGDVTLNGVLDIGVAKLTKQEIDVFKEFTNSVQNPANWAVRLGGVSAGAFGGGKFNKFMNTLTKPGASVDLSAIGIGMQKKIIGLFEQSSKSIDGKMVLLLQKLIEADKIKVVIQRA